MYIYININIIYHLDRYIKRYKCINAMYCYRYIITYKSIDVFLWYTD